MSKGVIVVGAGGHAKVCIELLHSMGCAVACCVGGLDSDDRCLDLPVYKGDIHLERLRADGHGEVFVAIGSNVIRQRLGRTAQRLGYRLVNAISPSATISRTARLGSGVAVMAGVVINASSFVGDLAIVNTLASVDHDGEIGEAAHIGPHCGLAGNVCIGERSFLGIGCKVIPEIVLGSDVVAGAGSVITSNVLSGSRIAGVPAKPIVKKS